MTIDRMGSVDPLKSLGKVAPAKTVRTDRSDSIELSTEAKSQAELLTAREIARSAPELRLERIEEIKAKMQDPNYFNKTVMESTAEGILKSFGL